MEIKSPADIRSASVMLTACVNNMCNTDDVEVIVNNFTEAKDYLVAIFKYNVEKNHR